MLFGPADKSKLALRHRLVLPWKTFLASGRLISNIFRNMNAGSRGSMLGVVPSPDAVGGMSEVTAIWWVSGEPGGDEDRSK